jgi:predicted O-methyltransferase YrrM
MADRLKFFKDRISQNRFWWFTVNDYLPDIYANLTDEQFDLLVAWFIETSKHGNGGEQSVPMMSTIIGVANGNGIDSIVELGTCYGHSALLHGWNLQRMGKKNGFITVDINERLSRFTQSWINKAGLKEYVTCIVSDSANQSLPEQCKRIFNKEIKAVIIDSSHQLEHTKKEIQLWYPNLVKGGLLFLHDVSDQAKAYDNTHMGGVHEAVWNWRIKYGSLENIMLNFEAPKILSADSVYQDGCGLGIIVK